MVERRDFTYERPPAGASSEGLEGYTLETARGDALGRVVAVLDHGGERWVAFSAGAPPLPGPLRAVPLADVADVDHDALVLSLRPGDVATVELDPERAVPAEEAEATRVTEVPGGTPAPQPPHAGPRDRARGPVQVALFVAGFFATMAVVALASTTGIAWLWAFLAVPAALLAAGLALGLATLRDPYER